LRIVPVVAVLALALGGCGAPRASTPNATRSGGTDASPVTGASATTRSTAETPPVAVASEIFGPAVGRWRPVAPMRHARTGFDAVLLGDATVLVVGDDFACLPGGAAPGSERAEVYDPTADMWVDVESLNKPRKVPATVALADGSALVIGGSNTDDQPFSSTKAFNPATRTWTSGPLLAEARGQPIATVIDGGRVLVLSDHPTKDQQSVETSGEILDPATGKWSPAGALPPLVTIGQIVGLSDGRVLGIGFDGHDSDPSPGGYLYDGSRDAWTPASAPPLYRGMLVPLRDGGALMIGGSDASGFLDGDGHTTARVSRFRPGSGQWTDVAPISTPRTDAHAVPLGDGRILVTGGTDAVAGTRTLTSTEIYDPSADRWVAAGDLGVARKDGQAVLLADGTVLLIGGDDSYDTQRATPFRPDPFKTAERFDPAAS
jgi:hypothetical protein